MKVYLAGTMVTDWRRQIIAAVPEVEFIEPARGEDWFERQCKQMEEAHVCFAVIGMEARHIGTVSELSAFRVMGKPRILVIPLERLNDQGYAIAEKLASPGMVTTGLWTGIGMLMVLRDSMAR